MKTAVIIRVYNRTEDLAYNLRIINDTWDRKNYHIIVVSNGYNSGYTIDDDSKKYIDELIVLTENSGHKKRQFTVIAGRNKTHTRRLPIYAYIRSRYVAV
ncbi:MAG: hypothetical protein ACLVKO_11060 [Dysgonomonas sp.]